MCWPSVKRLSSWRNCRRLSHWIGHKNLCCNWCMYFILKNKSNTWKSNRETNRLNCTVNSIDRNTTTYVCWSRRKSCTFTRRCCLSPWITDFFSFSHWIVLFFDIVGYCCYYTGLFCEIAWGKIINIPKYEKMTHKTEKKKQHYFSWFQLMSSCTRSDRIHISSLFKNASRYFLHYHNGLLCHSEGKKIIIVFRCARPPKWWCWMSCQFSKRIVLCFKHLCLYLNTWLILISLFRKDLTLFLLQHWHCFLLITLVISKNIQSSNLPSCHETDQFIIIYITKKIHWSHCIIKFQRFT